jgi:beta-glucosidase
MTLAVACCQTPVIAQSSVMDDRFTVLPGIQYGMGVSGPLKGDMYIPRRAGRQFPAVLMIHGGGWRSGDRMQMAKIARDLARKDYVVFSIDYDLVPTQFPVALDQCLEALRFLNERANEYQLDAARIAVMGSSAGGELAALMALGTPVPGTQPLRAAVVFNGVLDLQALGDQSGMVTDYLGGPCTHRLDACRQASPLYQVKTGGRLSFFVGHGTADAVVPYTQAEQFVSALRKNGWPVTTFVAEGGPHTYWGQPEFYEKNLASVLKFLADALSTTKHPLQSDLSVTGLATFPFQDADLPIDQRVSDLLARLTLDEKASQLVNQSRPIPRLGIPAYDWWSEALHGIAWGHATVFPEPIGLAATFDPALIHEMATVIGIEGRAKYNLAVQEGRRRIFEGLTFWSPNINIFRDPRWGRGQETYGEDPFLTSKMGVAFVTGLQGDDPRYLRVVATPKHFAVHSGPEPTRHEVDVKVSAHDLEDTYLPAFRATVMDGKAASVMCAYNGVNGQPGCANDFLLKEMLRDKWGFNGFVVSDCDAVADIQKGQHYTKTLAEAAAVSLKAGTDNDCADFTTTITDTSDYQRYLDAVKQGLLTEADIDRAVARLLRARFQLGMLDPDSRVKYAQVSSSEIDSPEHRQLARRIANESMVLLKNDGTLPLSKEPRKLLVVGPLADQTRVLEGNYHGTASYYVSALDGIRKEFAEDEVSFEPGTSFLRDPRPVPAEFLSHAPGQPGLSGEYFADGNLSGKPAVSRTDAQVNFDNHTAVTLPLGLNKSFVRWTGYLTPRESGLYRLGVDGLMDKLWLDDRQIVDDMTPHPQAVKTSEVHLEAGHSYKLTLEYTAGQSLRVRLVWAQETPDAFARATEAAKKADVVIAVVGITSDLEGEEMKVDVPGFMGGDRTSLDLPQAEEDLLEAVGRTGKPLIVVLMNGSALSVNWAATHANAILEAWYSGEEGGAAIAETLSGKNNPSGKLPVTFFRNVQQLPPFEDYAMTNRTYRYFTGDPLYTFGFGLSYSRFKMENLSLSSTEVHAGEDLGIGVDVSNVSETTGAEIVEVYITPPVGEGYPIHALRGILRIDLARGTKKHVSLTLKSRDLSFVDGSGERVISPGEYKVTVGDAQPGSAVAFAQTSLRIVGHLTLPR